MTRSGIYRAVNRCYALTGAAVLEDIGTVLGNTLNNFTGRKYSIFRTGTLACPAGSYHGNAHSIDNLRYQTEGADRVT